VSGRYAPHLQRRNGIFHLRLRVPDELRLRIGLREVRQTLRTHSATRATLLASIYIPRVREVFEVLRTEDFTKEYAQELLRSRFDDLFRVADRGYIPYTNCPDLEIQEQAALSRDHIFALEVATATSNFPRSLRVTASELCATNGWSFENLPEDRQTDLLQGLSRALVEQQKLYLFRLRDRLLPYTISDPLFRGAINCTGSVNVEVPLAKPSVGPTISDAISTYLDQGRRKWTGKTYAGRIRQLRYVAERFDGNRSLMDITQNDVRAYRDGIKRLRSNFHRKSSGTFAERQTHNPKHQISPKTAVLLFETFKAFLRWAVEDEGLLAANPAQHVKINVPKRVKGSKPRRPFSEAELRQLFSQPVFTGCLSAKRRYLAGTSLIRDDYFWIPVLGFYTGARLGEIVQLHFADLDLNGTMAFLSVTEVGGGEVGSTTAKHVKSQAGIRHVPLHPDVLDLGFREFVAARRTGRKPTERLFHRIPFGSDGQASTVFSKWFARFLDKAGLNDRTIVFHSFRHNAEDAFRNALQPQYVIDRIIGHSDGAVSAAYGEGPSLHTQHDAVCAMKLLVRVPDILRMNNPNQEAK
jgi:integrase